MIEPCIRQAEQNDIFSMTLTTQISAGADNASYSIQNYDSQKKRKRHLRCDWCTLHNLLKDKLYAKGLYIFGVSFQFW